MGNLKNERRIFNVSMVIFICLGITGTLIMMFGARFFTSLSTMEDAYYSIMAIAPTLFFVCVTAAYRGFFQGRHNMVPTAVSEVIEALGKLAIGLLAGFYAISSGYSTPVVAAFTISGLTIGVALGALYLFIVDLTERARNKTTIININGEKVKPRLEIVKEVFKIAIPITISSSLMSMASMIDSFTIVRRLQDIGYVLTAAEEIYGSYNFMAISFFNFPNALVVPFAISIIPVIATAFVNKQEDVIKKTIESTFRMVFIITMPLAMGMAAMSKPLLSLLFTDKKGVENVAPMLSILAIAIVFISVVTVTNSMLQAQKQENKTLISMALGAVAKLITSYTLIGIPQIGRFGAPIGTCVCYIVISSINFHFLSKYVKVLPALRKTFLKPFIAAAACAFGAILSYKLFELIISPKIATLIAVMIAAVIYLFLLFKQKTLLKEDVMLLPKGQKMYNFLHKLNFI